MKIFDSHAHYDDERFDGDRDELLASLSARGIGAVVNAACDLPSSRAGLALAERHEYIWSAAGIHPEHADDLDDNALQELCALAKKDRVVAIGEIGLDYYWEDNPPRDVQRAAFERQLELARRVGLPVIVHSRNAAQETFEILAKHHPRGVVHCFSGSAELARDYVKMGMYIGFTGVVTFHNARKPLEAAKAAGLEHILVETDCPYLAPVPFRGKRCDSTQLPYTVGALADAFGVSSEEVAAATWRNACTLYGIEPPNFQK